MKIGVSLIVRGEDAGPETFAAMAERAEALDFHALWCSAHIVLPPQERSGYVMIPGRKHPEFWKAGYWEPFTVLGYLSAVTRRIRFGTSIVVLPMHNPFELAKQVAEVDVLSGGRFTFGVGVGWFEEEFEVLGQNFRNRGARTDDALRLMQAIWQPDPVSHDGRFYSVKDACFGPKPVQRPHPPIWVAGASEAAMRRAARFAECYHPVRPALDAMAPMRRDLDRLCEAEGRAAGSVGLAVKLPLVFKDGPPADGEFPTQGRPRDIADGLRRYRDAGACEFVLDFVPESRDVALDAMTRFAEEVRPLL